MQNLDQIPGPDTVELNCLPDYSPESEQLVIFELVVPVAAKVPAPRQRVELAKLVVRQASITSTVPGKALALLRANNTALGAGWCITATLTVPRPSGSSSLC